MIGGAKGAAHRWSKVRSTDHLLQRLSFLRDGDGRASPPDFGGRKVVQAAAGEYHSLAVLEDGTLVGFGNDTDGKASPPDLGGRRVILPLLMTAWSPLSHVCFPDEVRATVVRTLLSLKRMKVPALVAHGILSWAHGCMLAPDARRRGRGSEKTWIAFSVAKILSEGRSAPAEFCGSRSLVPTRTGGDIFGKYFRVVVRTHTALERGVHRDSRERVSDDARSVAVLRNA